jgi:hypothetical protein
VGFERVSRGFQIGLGGLAPPRTARKKHTVDISNAVVEVERRVVEFVVMRVAEIGREDVAPLHADILRRLVEVAEVPHCLMASWRVRAGVRQAGN